MNGVRSRSFRIPVPLDHSKPNGETVHIFVRELVFEKDDHHRASLAPLLYLQGGPGFESPRPAFPLGGWMKEAVASGFRLLLLDQRGTGLSDAISPGSLLQRFGEPATAGDVSDAVAEQQADFMSHFRADSIVRDCEMIKKVLSPTKKWTLLGQSFGGFVALNYMSAYPNSLEQCLLTVGLAPVSQTIDDVYRATHNRMKERNRRFFERYPLDAAKVRDIGNFLRSRDSDGQSVSLPGGGVLSLRRFLASGLLLGSAEGMERLHFMLEGALVKDSDNTSTLSPSFLTSMSAMLNYETNPIYWLLHESIYCDGPGQTSNWSYERIRRECRTIAKEEGTICPFDADAVLDAWDGSAAVVEECPVAPYFTGEMVGPWIGEDCAALRPLRKAAHILASKDNWAPLYDKNVLSSCGIPVAALVSYDDVFVERTFSESTADLLGRDSCHLWVTNEFQHSGLRDEPNRIFKTLLSMVRGEVPIPS